MGMQRRRVHGIMADPGFDPKAIMNDDYITFEKSMESIGTIQNTVPARLPERSRRPSARKPSRSRPNRERRLKSRTDVGAWEREPERPCSSLAPTR